MKSRTDPRHQSRINTIKVLFENSFRSNSNIPKTSEASRILMNLKAIDKLIFQNAPAWPLDQIARVDLAALRLAVWELKFKKKKEPYKAIIDEAVEIAKEYGSESSPKFVNGVLGAVMKPK